MNRQTKRLIIGGTAVAVVAATTWAIVVTRIANRAPVTQATGEMTSMEGMAGMDMTSDGSVRLTANQISQFGITFGTVDMRMMENEVRTVGIVNFDETRLTQVAPKFGGFVERLHANFTGQPVQRGQPLLEVYSPELVAAQEELLIAKRLERTMDESTVPGVPAGSSNLLAAAKRRLQLWDITEVQIDEIVRTGKVQRSLMLYAPASGVVVEKNVMQGQATQPGQTLYTIANLSEVWVEAELREADAGGVRVGSGASIELAAFPGRPFNGRVEYVYPTLQAQARTLKARIAVANTDGRLKPGMYATVRVTTATQRALTVPASAVMRTGERTMVFVDMGGGRLMPQVVETGRTGKDYVEVLSGVEPGQRVVTSAQFLLDSESNLGDVMRAMIGMGGDLGDMKGMDMPGMDMPKSSLPPQR
jgi:Cu(I)/Ag(I) efflux system membrane fusion protein